MSDKYQKAVRYLTERPKEILFSWLEPTQHPAGCLFQFATTDGMSRMDGENQCGCLTEIRCGLRPAATTKLTMAIRRDKRIPHSGEDITVEHLPIFAEWQARLDRELRCKDEVLK